jgi:phenylalanyl-tRNA synthetase beta chain
LEAAISVNYNGETVAELGKVRNDLMAKFDIKQPVFFADLYWETIIEVGNKKVQFKEISRYPSVERDLAIVVPKTMKYKDISEQLFKLRLNKLQQVRLFDVFESEKLGKDKKSMAINLTFMDEEKTLTDKEIDGWMNKIMSTLEKELNAEVRK